MLQLTSVEGMGSGIEIPRPAPHRRPATASASAPRLHGSHSATSIPLVTTTPPESTSQPASRPSTATLPHLGARSAPIRDEGAPRRDPTVLQLRQRNRQLEAEVRDRRI